MKTKALSILLTVTFLLAFITCKKELDPNIETFEITKERITEGTTTWTIDGTYDYPGVIDGIKACVSGDGVNMEFEAELNGKDFSVTMTGLKPATEYQYHYAVDYGFSKPFLTETKTFTTLSSESPTVKALEILKIDSTTYRVKCQVIADGGTEVTERGICWNTFGTPTLDDSFRRYEGDMGVFDEYSVYMDHLTLGKKYYVRAYAKNAAGKTGLSEDVLDFVTEASAGMTVDIELSCNPEAGGTIISGGGSYEVGTQCTATAEANTGYTFINWTENDVQVSSEASYTFTVTTARSLVANFTKQAYVITVQVDPEGSGTVTGAGGYDYGEECNLTAATIL